MMSLAETRVLFIATAGRRRGTDSLEQYLSIARALGVRPLVAVAGTRTAAEEAVAIGADVIAEATPAVIRILQADVVVVDDPIAAQIGGWIITAQQAGALVVTAEDLGLQTLTRSAAHNVTFFAETGSRRETRFGAHQ
jgi:hypothetical protein